MDKRCASLLFPALSSFLLHSLSAPPPVVSSQEVLYTMAPKADKGKGPADRQPQARAPLACGRARAGMLGAAEHRGEWRQPRAGGARGRGGLRESRTRAALPDAGSYGCGARVPLGRWASARCRGPEAAVGAVAWPALAARLRQRNEQRPTTNEGRVLQRALRRLRESDVEIRNNMKLPAAARLVPVCAKPQLRSCSRAEVKRSSARAAQQDGCALRVAAYPQRACIRSAQDTGRAVRTTARSCASFGARRDRCRRQPWWSRHSPPPTAHVRPALSSAGLPCTARR
jgi:hypothetical protein